MPSAGYRVAGGLGFEPRQPESESGVLPLDDPPSGPPSLTLKKVPAGTAPLDQPPPPCKDGFSALFKPAFYPNRASLSASSAVALGAKCKETARIPAKMPRNLH